MKIECRPKEGRKFIFVVFLDEEPWREIHQSVFGKFPKIELSGQNPDELESSFRNLEYTKAKSYCIRLLSNRNYSSYEMVKKFKETLISNEITDQILTEFKELGYIDDQNWLESYIRSQMERKQGPKVLAMKLKQKGVPEEVIATKIEALEPSFPQKERIKTLLATKYKRRDLSDYKERQKVIGALFRKGFDIEEIKAVLNTDEED